jgi:hypothetical protein
MLFHPYEKDNYSPAYLTPSATAHLLPDDPIRNIRWNLRDGQHPWLTYPNGNWEKGDLSPPQEIWYVSFFIDREGRVVLVPKTMYWAFMDGMKSDALREE